MLRLLFACSSLLMVAAVLPASPITCITTATPTIVHGEGITERAGDIVFTCSGGSPNAAMTVDLSIFLNVNITNRLASASSNALLDIIFTADNGTGPQPIAATPILTGQASLEFNGVTFTLSPTGSVTLGLANIRGAANQLNFAANSTLQALIGSGANASIDVYKRQTQGSTRVRRSAV